MHVLDLLDCTDLGLEDVYLVFVVLQLGGGELHLVSRDRMVGPLLALCDRNRDYEARIPL